MSKPIISVLFVCLGNICRSPTAHAVFQSKVRQAGLQNKIVVDSAGTGNWHIGDPPDARSVEVAEHNGYDMSGIFARQICTEDIQHFDYILAMDKKNIEEIQRNRYNNKSNTLDYFLSFSENAEPLEVPDPYFGPEDSFEHVLKLIEDASDGLLDSIRQRLNTKI